MDTLRTDDKILFNYFNPKNGKYSKQKGKVRKLAKYGYGYIVEFITENDTYIDDDKINKVMKHSYYVNEDNYLQLIERG